MHREWQELRSQGQALGLKSGLIFAAIMQSPPPQRTLSTDTGINTIPSPPTLTLARPVDLTTQILSAS